MVTGPGLDFEENRRDGEVEEKVEDGLFALGSGECRSGPGGQEGNWFPLGFSLKF